MANRIMLNQTSYHGAGAIAEIVTEAKAHASGSIRMFRSGSDQVRCDRKGNRSAGQGRSCL